MDDPRQQMNQLGYEASMLPNGAAKIALLEEAVRLADAANDVDAGFTLRMDLTQAATFGGRHDLSIVAYSWCLAQADREPDRYLDFELLWQYKWVVDHAFEFADISLAKIYELLEDLRRRFHEFGASEHAYHKLRRDVARETGDHAKALAAHADLLKVKRDYLSDCEACVANNDIRYHLFVGDRQRALKEAKPLLEGRMSCAEVPHSTHGFLLLPLLAEGRADDAAASHKTGLRMIQRTPEEFVMTFGQHMVYLVVTRQMPAAIKLLNKCLIHALHVPGDMQRFEFYVPAKFLFDTLAADGETTVKLRLPTEFPAHVPSGNYSVQAMANWFTRECEGLAKRFDARNGNGHFTAQIGETATWAEMRGRIGG